MEEKKRIVFILNPISGTHSKKEIPGLIDKLLDKEQFDYELRLTEYAGHAAEIARRVPLRASTWWWPSVATVR